MVSNLSSSFSFSFASFSLSTARPFQFPQFFKCYDSVASSIIFTSFTITSFLFLLPICALILYVGIKQWRTHRQTSLSHSDFITYNIIAMEPIGLAGCLFYCCGNFLEVQIVMEVGIYVLFLVYLGRLLLQCLTCVEQYLAVIHPMIYLKMKTARGLMVRNGSIACVWVTCLLMGIFCVQFSPSLPVIPFFAFFIFGLLVILFCSVSVLSALVRPDPGDVFKDRKRVNQAKKRAFLNISFVTAIMILKIVGLLVCTALHASGDFDKEGGCVALLSAFWFCLPSSLSVPLLFLHRVRLLPCFGRKTKLEQNTNATKLL